MRNSDDANFWHGFHVLNVDYVLTLFTRYQENHQSVTESTQAYFRQHSHELEQVMMAEEAGGGETAVSPPPAKIKAAVNLSQAVREYGHLAAQLDPLGTPPPGDPSLEAAYYELTEDDLRQLPADLIGGPAAENAPHALAAISELRRIYAGAIGYDYDHLRSYEERTWLRHMAETCYFVSPNTG